MFAYIDACMAGCIHTHASIHIHLPNERMQAYMNKYVYPFMHAYAPIIYTVVPIHARTLVRK